MLFNLHSILPKKVRGERNMRASLGVPSGRKVMPYHPELFQEYEEVIIYPREEFKRNFLAIKEHLNYIFRKNFLLEMDENWKLLSEWPRLMDRVHIINTEMNHFLSLKDSQSYLDAYLYVDVVGIEDELLESSNIASEMAIELQWL